MHDHAMHMPKWGIHAYNFVVSNYDRRKWLWERIIVSFEVVGKLFQELEGINPRALQVIGETWISRDF
jgi:hypothetical protein